MATKEAQVQALFEKLDGFIASDQHAKAAKVASDSESIQRDKSPVQTLGSASRR